MSMTDETIVVESEAATGDVEPVFTGSASPPSESVDQPIVVIGFATGGLVACRDLLAALGEVDVPVVIAARTGRHEERVVVDVLDGATPAPVRLVRHGDVMRPGVVHVAPVGRSCIVAGDRFELVGEQRSISAIDTLFESVAEVASCNAVGVVLSGTGSDGSSGAGSIDAHGGQVFVQAGPALAHAEMPVSAHLRCSEAVATSPTEIGRVLGHWFRPLPTVPMLAELLERRAPRAMRERVLRY